MKIVSNLVILGVLVVVLEASPFQNLDSSKHDCDKPFFSRGIRECCSIPRQRIWGDLSRSFQACGRRLRNHVGALVSAAPEEGTTNMSASIIATNETETKDDEPVSNQNRGKRIWDKVGDIMKAAYDAFKNWMGILQDSIVILTDRYGRRGNKECIMECVFEQEGFIEDHRLNKETILARIKSNKEDGEEWHKVALAAVQTCLKKNYGPSTNSLCNSGASELFECVFKEIFFNCPSWPENNEYCDSLKDFYQRCPDSPPLPMEEKIPSFTDAPENVTERV